MEEQLRYGFDIFLLVLCMYMAWGAGVNYGYRKAQETPLDDDVKIP